MIRAALRLVAALALSAAVASPAFAHNLRIFAEVEGGEVIVTARFSSGGAPTQGEVRVFDADARQVLPLPLADGAARFAPPDGARERGLRIEVHTSHGHSDWWALTPADLAED